MEGNNLTHNCIECNNYFSFKIKINNFFNCYKNCSYYYYFDNENNFQCTINLSCTKDYPKLKENKKECTKYNNKDIIINLT